MAGLTVIGAHGTIENVNNFLKKADKVAKNYSIKIQFFDADKIYGKEQLEIAYEHALRAFELGDAITKDLMSELLLYASCQHQIKVALKRIGISEKTQNIVIAVLDDGQQKAVKAANELLAALNLGKNDVFGAGDSVLKYYGITQKETEYVTKERREEIILEKIALLHLMK
jgi:tRNA threonylcarbamoyladenosine modification (KEOPS) complex Cgi121 subunit